MRYGEQETSDILRRAAEMQAQRTGETAALGSGLTLAEIERAAADIGIRPEYIRAAVGEQDVGRLRIVPSGVMEIRRDTTGPITEGNWREMVDVLQQSFGKVGVSSRTGDTFEWQLKSDPDPHTRPSVHVLVHSRPGGSEIVLRSAERQVVTRGWIIGAAASPIVGFFLTLFLSLGNRYMGGDAAFTLMGLFAIGTMVGTGFAIKSWLRRDRKKLAGIVDLLGYVSRGATVSEAGYSSIPASASVVEPQALTLGRSGGG